MKPITRDIELHMMHPICTAIGLYCAHRLGIRYDGYASQGLWFTDAKTGSTMIIRTIYADGKRAGKRRGNWLERTRSHLSRMRGKFNRLTPIETLQNAAKEAE